MESLMLVKPVSPALGWSAPLVSLFLSVTHSLMKQQEIPAKLAFLSSSWKITFANLSPNPTALNLMVL